MDFGKYTFNQTEFGKRSLLKKQLYSNISVYNFEGKDYVIKKCRKRDHYYGNSENPYREYAVSKLFSSNPYIISAIDKYEENDYIYLLFPYIEGEDLCSYFMKNKDVSESKISRIFKKMFCLIKDIHSSKICHFDISLENFIMDEKEDIYLCDFARASKSDDGMFNIKEYNVGKEMYKPPELFNISKFKKLKENNEESKQEIKSSGEPEKFSGEKADIFSLGVCLHCMKFGKFPFGSNREKHSTYFAELTKISDVSLRYLLIRMLCKEKYRYSLEEIEKSNWFLEN